ncbi:hypothetical protein QVD17_21645 [Tagetes erecta]|uniref:DUF7722 domain-containing protein n=1 Tax=Tagetes erecta TaxID=13708 RepID=A0AAD8KCM4_TARER|nr:hypothetical protein QVD17_21645 [Tagetes erecta]
MPPFFMYKYQQLYNFRLIVGRKITKTKQHIYYMGSLARPVPNANGHQPKDRRFEMPLHYPRYTREEYETMPEWKLDCLLSSYGLPITGDVNQKRKFAMGAFLWQY